jgi:hypothetical protein
MDVVEGLTEAIFYLWVVGTICGVVFLCGCLSAAFLVPRTRKAYFARVTKLGGFFLIFLFVGAVFEYIWGALIEGHLYQNVDYFLDFLPFWPITRATVYDPFNSGRLLGVTLIQLQLVWLLFTIGTWGITLLLYKLVTRRSGREPKADHHPDLTLTQDQTSK